ncbi:MAG: PaaI family thioesterase [Thermoflavifilum sp.]|nr:PaaI family thioesterase [Thermoflavifilum sp.]MCL6513126.1 PaaI family thioesterase [Alicyclobacillus sp.]
MLPEHHLQSDPNIVEWLREGSKHNLAWNLIGIRVEDAGHGWAQLRLPFDPKLRHPGMRVHGGFLATLADSAVAAALMPMLEPGEDLVTIDLKINYLRSVRDTDVIGLAKVKHKGRTTALFECTLYDAESGKQVAYCTALYMILRRDGA